MRTLPRNQSKMGIVIAMATFVTAGACTQRPNTPTAPPSPAAEQAATLPSAGQTTPLPTATPGPEASGPARLEEVRLIETGGQRSVLFRFSRPPEGVDYFPLRNPNRLVVDIKGTVEPPVKIQTHKTSDGVVSAVRVGTYQGKLRLVIDLKNATPPQFSVDNYETLVTAFIGEKDAEKSAVHSHAQVLFLSEDARSALTSSDHGVGEKIAAPTEATQSQLSTTASALTEEKIASAPAASPSAETPRNTTRDTAQVAAVQGEPATEKIDSAPVAVAPPSEAPQDATREIAQVAPIQPESATPSPRKANRAKKSPEARAPLLAEEPLSGSATSREFQPGVQYTGRKISLDFKNADVHDVFRILADVSGLNLVATDDVKAKVTLRLIEVPWDQALDVVLQANGLEKNLLGNVLSISTAKRLESERNAKLLAQNANQKLATLETAYVRINYIKATDVVKMITYEEEQEINIGGGAGGGSKGQRPAGAGGTTQIALMSPRGTLAADPTTNVVIIRDTIDRISAIREMIQQIDVQTPQVVIESYLITTSENLSRDLGIQWGYGYRAGPGTGNPTGRNFPGSLGFGGSGLGKGSSGIPFIADFPAATSAGSGSALDLVLGSLSGSQALAVRLSALEREGKARVVSRPRVVTINNKVAEIKSRRTVRVPKISGSLNVGGQGSTQGGGDAFQEFDVGVTLKITPQISSDGFVLLDVSAESSELTAPSVTSSAPSAFIPVIPDSLLRTASSNVLIRAGETFVLGGILSDGLKREEEGTPYLRKIPGLGWLFRGDTNSRVKDELLVFITPRIVPGVPVKNLPSAQQLWETRPQEGGPVAAAKDAAMETN
ncbi:MAG: type IV pilus secretin family protein [Deltaproteobacteria bacterium]|nr:type IV pilus secretin family protein [Deltaproteobacteria bacterium]